MMSLLFLLFLIAIALAMLDKERPALAAYAVAMVTSLFWFYHHVGATLNIQL